MQAFPSVASPPPLLFIFALSRGFRLLRERLEKERKRLLRRLNILMHECLNYGLNRVYTWLSANKMTLNLTKTEFMLVASRQKLSTFPEIPSFSINDHLVEQVSSTKSLGVHIDQNMGMSHTEHL